jgi:hypothetical protein
MERGFDRIGIGAVVVRRCCADAMGIAADVIVS